MPTAEDDRMIWLSKAHRVIETWDKEQPGSQHLSMAASATLASSIATALQRAYDQGRSSARHP